MVDIKVIYQDDYILVLNKPSNLVVDPSDTYKEETLSDILQRDFHIQLFRGGIVHRLDKDTSGIILVAKTQEALDNLQSQFKLRAISKEYITLVHGSILEKGIVEGNIIRNSKNRERFIVTDEDEGKKAVTEYQPIGNFQFSIFNFQSIFNDYNKIQMRKLEKMKYNQFTLLRCFPKTGRTHQIRVHLKYINHSIVTDEKYVGRKTFRLDKRWCPRLFLHAAKIGFNHPVSGERMELESALPEDLSKVLTSFEQYPSSAARS